MPRLSRWMPWVFVGLGPLILFGPMLVRGRVLFWGTPMLQFVPWHTFALEVLKGGHIPLWNPWLGMGAPLLANYQSALLYPPNVLLALVGPAWGNGLLVMLHLAWAGMGMVFLTRRLGFGALAQTAAGLAFGLSGYLVARAGFLSINATAAWLPWAVAAADRLAEMLAASLAWRRLWSAVVPLSLALGLQWLAGHAQTAWYSLLIVVAWAAGRGWAERRLAGALRAGAGLLAAGPLGFALAAGQLLPTLEYLAQSYRATRLDAEFALTYSFWPWRLLGLVAPDLFGNPAHADFWGYGNFWEDAVYLGVLPLLLAVGGALAALRGRGARPALGRCLVAGGAAALLLALGKNTPVFPYLADHVPTFGLFQAPARWNLVTVFCLALLAAAGMQAWRPAAGRGLYWTRLGTAGAGAVIVFAFAARVLLPGLQPTFPRALGQAGAWLFAAGLLALTRRLEPGRVWAGAVGLVMLADLAWAGWGLNPDAPADLYRGPSALADLAGTQGRLYMPPDLEQEAKFIRSFRFDTFAALPDWRPVRDAGLPDTTLLDGLPSANNFDPLLIGRYVTWMTRLQSLPAEQQQVWLGLMDVGQAALRGDGPLGVRYAPVAGPARVRLVPQAAWAAGPEDSLEQVAGRGFDPWRVVVLEGPPLALAAGGIGQAEVVPDVDPNRLSVAVSSEHGGWLVVSDVWYPGWHAQVDGAEVPIYRADYLFRAIPLPHGTHRVEFVYRPLTFLLGGLLSLAAWGCVLGLGWLRRGG